MLKFENGAYATLKIYGNKDVDLFLISIPNKMSHYTNKVL